MSGGSSFNEVFFNDVRVHDSMRLGEVGDGWRVALTTLGFERDRSGVSRSARVGGTWAQLLATARAAEVTDDPSSVSGWPGRTRMSASRRWVNQRMTDVAVVRRRVRRVAEQAAVDQRDDAVRRCRVRSSARCSSPTPERGGPTSGASTSSAPRVSDRRRLGRDPAQHHRRARPRPAARAASRQGRRLAGRPPLSA